MESRSQVTLAVTAATFSAASLFVALRFASRIGIVRKVSLDDYFMLLAWVIAFGLSFGICYGTSVGLGRHQADIPDEWLFSFRRSQYAVAVLYNPALMATKTSILVFYFTLSKTQKLFKWCGIATLAVVNIAGLALTLLNIFQCRPVDAAFKVPLRADAGCINIVTLFLSSAPVNIITDCAILLLPMPILTGMRLPLKQKTILVITFSFGIFVAVVDVVRTAYLQEAQLNRLRDVQQSMEDSSPLKTQDSDFSWYASLTFMWSAVEVNVGIMCACVPMLKPLVARFLPRLLHSVSDSSKQNTNPKEYSDAAQAHMSPRSPLSPVSGANNAPSDGLQKSMEEKRDPERDQESRMEENAEAKEEIDIMDFLTTPEASGAIQQQASRSSATGGATSASAQPYQFFDFVNMDAKKSMVDYSDRESYFPIIMVTVLFFIWGFAYGLLNVLNRQFQIIARMSNSQSVGIPAAYFAGYLVAPLTFGRLVLKHWGFKACYTVGLAIYACGILIFWPSAVLASFPAFLSSNFIVGMGLSILEVAANPFIALCGPAENAEIRLNLSQGVQAIGAIISPLLARKVFFRNTESASSLIDVQWTYLGIALLTILLALGYIYVPLPEATDDEFEEATQKRVPLVQARFKGVRLIWIGLGMAVVSQFAYVGAQEALSTSFDSYLRQVKPGLNTTDHSAISHTAFAISRFFAALLGVFIKPRYLLAFFYLACVVVAALAMNWSGNTPSTLIVLLYFFEGPLFALIFAIPLRSLGRHTKIGAALITAATSGGSVFPPISNAVAKSRGSQYSFSVVVAAFAFGTVYPIYLNAVPVAGKQVDPVNQASVQHTAHASQEDPPPLADVSGKARESSLVEDPQPKAETGARQSPFQPRETETGTAKDLEANR